MGLRQTVSRVNGALERIGGALGFVPPLVTRIVIGLGFFQAGTGKIRNFESTVGFFDSLGVPFPAFNAGLVSCMESVTFFVRRDKKTS
jgi:uncharacterized membrane protein YphA (DoxX/SURF4 family)